MSDDQDPTHPPGVAQIGSQSVPLDGDLVFLIDAVYREFAVKRGFEPAYGNLRRELERIIDEMAPEVTREYFAQSLFLNYVTYENEMADRLAAEIKEKAQRPADE